MKYQHCGQPHLIPGTTHQFNHMAMIEQLVLLVVCWPLSLSLPLGYIIIIMCSLESTHTHTQAFNTRQLSGDHPRLSPSIYARLLYMSSDLQWPSRQKHFQWQFHHLFRAVQHLGNCRNFLTPEKKEMKIQLSAVIYQTLLKSNEETYIQAYIQSQRYLTAEGPFYLSNYVNKVSAGRQLGCMRAHLLKANDERRGVVHVEIRTPSLYKS